MGAGHSPVATTEVLCFATTGRDVAGLLFFFFKQKTAYEIGWCDWSSDVCSSDLFAFAPLPEAQLKGRAEAVEAWRLERELPDRPRMHGGEARLVGRERELNQLESALEEARSGRGLMVALVGEPGIGKSRLALEMRHLAEASGFATAWTSSRSYASAFPYHLVSQLLTQLMERPDGAGTADVLKAKGVT